MNELYRAGVKLALEKLGMPDTSAVDATGATPFPRKSESIGAERFTEAIEEAAEADARTRIRPENKSFDKNAPVNWGKKIDLVGTSGGAGGMSGALL